jgi:hypothetical protein
MDKRFSLNEREELEELAQEFNNLSRKVDKLFWTKIEAPLTLAESLARLTKDELSDIRNILGIPGLSALKKQELIDSLVVQIPNALPNILFKFDETRYKLLKKVAAQGGSGYAELELEHIAYFRERALLFSGTVDGKKTLVMPQEIVQLFKNYDSTSYRARVQRNTEWIKLVQGMLYYYGVVDHAQLSQLMRQHSGSEVDKFDFNTVLDEAEAFYMTFDISPEGFALIDVPDVEQVAEEHALRAQVPYYPFTKAQLLQAGEPNFVHRNLNFEAFVSFIRANYDISKAEAEEIVQECADDFQSGRTPNDSLPHLQEILEIETIELIQGFMDQLVSLYNNTKQWDLKGYTPNELSSMRSKVTPIQAPMSSPFGTPNAGKAKVVSFSTRKEVSRNDPCPCGSGKKFKKCCGG